MEIKEICKKILIVIVAILLIVVCIYMSILNYIKIDQQNLQEAEITGNFNSIEDILKYYGCKHIKTRKSELEGFSVDIYTSFKYELYDGEENNEDFFNAIIKKIAELQNYQSFRLIDETKEERIEIQVFGDKKSILKIVINGIEDYFIYMDSQIDAKKYKEIKESNLVIESPELLNCIENGWDKQIEFGTRESIFQNYYIFFDEGIKTRIISGKLYNIVFTDKYVQNVLNGLNPTSKKDLIIEKLGQPTFKNQDGTLIGYKSKDIYVFFVNNEISVYRNVNENYDTFLELIDEFLDKKYSFLELMNELTYIWPDYETYNYSEDSVFLSYPNKGIDVKINYENTDGIIIYNNIGIEKELVKKYLEHTEFVSNRRIDNIYNAELRRYKNENDLSQKCDEYRNPDEGNDDRNRSKLYKYYMDTDVNGNIKSTYFISQSDEYFNNQLIENIDSYIWKDDTTFVYSKANRGIYSLDLTNGKKSIIINGEESFQIDSYENGVLLYDNEKTIEI